ncbi:MAG: four helix bundle protein [Bacteroidia bacterium]|nr:four helix bundle protein [Bacteroidia bacterium]
MSTLKSFEDIKAWKEARVLSNEIYLISKEGGLEKDYALKDQMNRSSGSIMDNIAEGFGRGGSKEFANFLSFSMGSAQELKSQLFRALDRGYISREQFDYFYNKSESISKMIYRLIEYLNNSDFKGEKFKGRR